MKVIKRDGTIQEFSFAKIENVVKKGFQSVGEDVPDKFLEQLLGVFQDIINKHDSDYKMSIEDIYETIRNMLIKKNKYNVVESFIVYKNERDRIRESKSRLIKNIAKALKATDIQNQNANVDEASFGGRMGEATRVVTKDYALKYCMSKKAKDNHQNNEIYIHKQIVA